jgi:hypothetical protein
LLNILIIKLFLTPTKTYIFFYIFVTLRVSTPVTHAKPAKFVLALAASHVHASLILFDILIAFWARFCVYFYPSGVQII